jgi:hypothetical protein
MMPLKLNLRGQAPDTRNPTAANAISRQPFQVSRVGSARPRESRAAVVRRATERSGSAAVRDEVGVDMK